jgi:hypothetical protein
MVTAKFSPGSGARGLNWGATILSCFIALAFSCGARALEIVGDGSARAVIVIPDDAGPTPSLAAKILRDYIRKISGCELGILPESKAPESGALISVGRTAMSRRAGLTTDDLKYDGCKLLTRGRVLYLLGNDYSPPPGAPGKDPEPGDGRPRGTIRAVTKFLEDIAGVRWYLPGPEGEFVPSLRDLSAPDTFSVSFSPQTACASTGYDTPAALWANNGRRALNVKFYGGHSWYAHLPSAEYAVSHPEYFIMDVSGKRNPERNHLCTANPGVRRIILEKMRAVFDSGYDVIELGQTDGWLPCLCPECQKKYGDGKIPPSAEHPAERIWEMHKWLIDELGKSHPGKMVMPLVYGPTNFPSKLFDRFPDNTLLEFTFNPADELWRGAFKQCVVYDTYIWESGCVASCFVPSMDPSWLGRRMRMLRRHGVIGLYGGGRGSFGLGGPSLYAYAKLAGDPDTDTDRLVSEYCRAVYAEAGRIMERFFNLFHSRSGKTLLEFNGDRLSFQNGRPMEDTFCALYPPDVTRRLDLLLKKAEETVKNERAKGWLKHTRDEFDGLKTTAEMLAAKRAFELSPSKSALLLTKEKVDAFEDWRARILSLSKDPAHTKRWFPRYVYFCNDLITGGDHSKFVFGFRHPDLTLKETLAIANGERSARGKGVGSAQTGHGILEPLTWDFDRMMANIDRPAQERKIIARRASVKPGADGTLPPEAWQDVPAVEFEPYRTTSSRMSADTRTFARVLYDDENLHARYECGEPNPENMRLTPVPRDGNVWRQDEVEIFLNPEGSGRKFMHFMAAPVRDAMYDERKGYIEDQLDPRLAEADITWSPGWTCAHSIDRENKRWTLEMTIPFRSLGVKTPAPGAVWTGNLARCRRAGGGEELSCWIPDGFGNPEIFGEIVFTGPDGETTDAAAPQAPSGETSLLKNGGFETDGDGGKPAGWSVGAYPEEDLALTGRCRVSREKAHGGKNSLKIDLQNLKTDASSKASQIVFRQQIDPGTVRQLRGRKVRLSAWLNYDFIDEDTGAPNFPGPFFRLRAWGKSGAAATGDKPLPAVFLSHDTFSKYGVIDGRCAGQWIPVSQDGWVPEDAERMDIQCGIVAWDERLKKANLTKVYIDDICLEAK